MADDVAALYAYLDVHTPSDPKMMAAGAMGELLYYRGVFWCRDHLTDGFIDDKVLAFVGHGIPRHRRVAELLVTVGLWERVAHGYAIPLKVWRRHNPLAAEVQSKRDREAERRRAERANPKGECPPGQGGQRGPSVRADLA